MSDMLSKNNERMKKLYAFEVDNYCKPYAGILYHDMEVTWRGNVSSAELM